MLPKTMVRVGHACWHAVMISRRNEGGQNAAVTEGVTSFKANMTLNDDRLLDVAGGPGYSAAIASKSASARNFSTSSAAMQPMPAAVTACR